MNETNRKINETDRKKRLRKFLLDRRGSLKPRDVGLPDRGGRRCCPGLRREEVADLAGVSVTWYTLFEMARRTSSMRMVDRVARALLLDEEDRSTLLRLAIPEVARAWEVYEDQSAVSRMHLLDLVHDFALTLADSQSEDEAVDSTMRRIVEFLAPIFGAEEVRVDPHNVILRRRLLESRPLVADSEILSVASDLRDGGEPFDSGDGIACVPVRACGRLVSIIFVAGGPSRTYPPEELRLLATVAALLGGHLGACWRDQVAVFGDKIAS
jgi:transcriptional regulator with XRE-family HTH domain